jgi:hypothetical protein
MPPDCCRHGYAGLPEPPYFKRLRSWCTHCDAFPRQNRLEELAEIFAVFVGGFSVMNNHLHLLLRLDPEVARAWSDEEVVRRWGRIFPPRDKSRQPIPVSEHWVQSRLADPKWVANARERLQNLGWFMVSSFSPHCMSFSLVLSIVLSAWCDSIRGRT